MFKNNALIIFAAILAATAAQAQTFPTKAVRITIGFAAGASTDLVGRMAAQKLSEAWGQSVIVDNRPGAGANIAAELVAKSAPDGYSLLVAQNALAIAKAMYPKLGYDPVRDLVPVGSIASAPHILLVHPSFPARSVKELVALAKRRPGELNYASSGIGINDHLCGELLRLTTGINVVHVPYKGGNLASADVISGQIAFYFSGMPVGLPLHKSGRLRGIAVTSKVRYERAPEIPTVIESGVPGYEVLLWQALFAPAATPQPLLTKISADLQRAIAAPDLRERLAGSGVDVFPGDATEFGRFFRSEVDKWSKVVRDANIRAE